MDCLSILCVWEMYLNNIINLLKVTMISKTNIGNCEVNRFGVLNLAWFIQYSYVNKYVKCQIFVGIQSITKMYLK